MGGFIARTIPDQDPQPDRNEAAQTIGINEDALTRPTVEYDGNEGANDAEGQQGDSQHHGYRPRVRLLLGGEQNVGSHPDLKGAVSRLGSYTSPENLPEVAASPQVAQVLPEHMVSFGLASIDPKG